MISYRSFLNTDPPALVDIWQQQSSSRSLPQVVTRKILDQMVFAKPYFDAAGLILALDGETVVGFAHAGFAPNHDLSCIDHSVGILTQLRIADRDDSQQIAAGLWSQVRKYYQSFNTHTCYAASQFPHSPFYTGLYGGSRVPGIASDDHRALELLSGIGFVPHETIEVLQIGLNGFRPQVNRAQMSVRRQHQVTAIVDPLLPNWWECCTFGWAEIYGFRVANRRDGTVLGRVMFWDIQPLSAQWGTPTMGLVDLEIDTAARNQGLATFLVGESLRLLAAQGVANVEFQMRASDTAAAALARRIGFEQITSGSEMVISLT